MCSCTTLCSLVIIVTVKVQGLEMGYESVLVRVCKSLQQDNCQLKIMKESNQTTQSFHWNGKIETETEDEKTAWLKRNVRLRNVLFRSLWRKIDRMPRPIWKCCDYSKILVQAWKIRNSRTQKLIYKFTL